LDPVSYVSATRTTQLVCAPRPLPAIRSVPGVRRVHDLHAWTLTSGRYAMGAHVVVDTPQDGTRLLEQLHALLHARFEIDHTTVQLESEPLVQITPRTSGRDRGAAGLVP
jgi:cobalt-zinc-cadmium efflux system protein